jgi:hypothetical protein
MVWVFFESGLYGAAFLKQPIIGSWVARIMDQRGIFYAAVDA